MHILGPASDDRVLASPIPFCGAEYLLQELSAGYEEGYDGDDHRSDGHADLRSWHGVFELANSTRLCVCR